MSRHLNSGPDPLATSAGRPKRLTPAMVARAVELRRQQHSVAAIARALSVSDSTVRRTLHQHDAPDQHHEDTHERPATGRTAREGGPPR